MFCPLRCKNLTHTTASSQYFSLAIKMKYFVVFILFLMKTVTSELSDSDIEENSSGWYQIEGKVYPPEIGTSENWQEDTQIIINGGKFH